MKCCEFQLIVIFGFFLISYLHRKENYLLETQLFQAETRRFHFKMLRLRKSSMNWDKSRRIFKFQFLVHARSLVTWIRMRICFNPELPRFVQMIDQSSNKSTVFGRGGQIIVYSRDENDYDNETWCMITKHFLGCTCVSLSAICWTTYFYGGL